MASQPIYIVDEVQAIVSAADAVLFPTLNKHINYMYGHYVEIINRLQLLTNSPNIQDRAAKYPLVALIQDFKEDRGIKVGVYGKVTLNIIIANVTLANYTSEQRYEQNFKPVLIPIYQELLNQFYKSRSTFIENDDKIKHTKIDRASFGRQAAGGPVANMFNDCLDVVEIQNLEISFYNK